MKSVLSAQFWNEEVGSSKSLDGVAHALPQEPPPLGLVAGTRLSRSQQLLLLQRFLAIPCTPSYAVEGDNKGGLVLDRVLGSTGGDNWWATLTGRVRPQRMGRGTSTTTTETSTSSGFEKLKESANQLLGGSWYALCLRSRVQLGRTTISSTSELDNLSRQSVADQQPPLGGVPLRGRVALRHKLDEHQILLEAAYHECYADRHSGSWEVPHTVSADVASRGALGGLRYRVGVHHSAGTPLKCSSHIALKPPQGSLPGLRIQAGASLEKSLSLWKGASSRSLKNSYSFLEARPGISLSGVLGGLVGVQMDPLYGTTKISQSLVDPNNGSPGAPDARYSTDMFASVGFNAQFGQFERRYLDFTKLGVRLDVGAASALISAISKSRQAASAQGWPICEGVRPTLAVSLQQQVLGPLRARVDSRVSVDPLNLKQQPAVQEIICGLDYPLDAGGAAKLCLWYSPTRREGMAEFRVLER